MAVIIENLNMPNTCTMCWISNICQEHIHDLTHIGYEKRLDDCPLREVVRCKDCMFNHWHTTPNGEKYHICNLNKLSFSEHADFYCAYGERREDDN